MLARRGFSLFFPLLWLGFTPSAREAALALRQRKRALVRRLALPPQVVRASVVERFGTCGKANCACHQGQKHGPYYYLTQCLVSDDTLEYVTERLSVTDLRQSLARIHQTFKANKVLESCKINGLLFVSLDANEHFNSRSRCCESPQAFWIVSCAGRKVCDRR